MGRPFRLVSERRQIARPSYGGEREPDSHPTPGPPTFVQSARVQPSLLGGRRRGAARGLSVLREGSCSSAASRSRPTCPPASGSPPAAAAALPAPSALSCRRRSRPTPASSTPPSATPGTTTSRCPGPRSPRTTAPRPPARAVGAPHRQLGLPGSDSQPPVWDDAPSEGHLPVAVAARLAAVLRRHTGTPEECRFGRWDGLRLRRGRRRAPPPAAAARRARRGRRPRHRRRRRPQPRPRAARAERQPVVAGRPGLVRGHRHRPDEHLRRRQRGVHRGAARDAGLEAFPAEPADPTSLDAINPQPVRS